MENEMHIVSHGNGTGIFSGFHESEISGLHESVFKPVYRSWNWNPKEDITVYELARILPIFGVRDSFIMSQMISCLSSDCIRHFEEIG